MKTYKVPVIHMCRFHGTVTVEAESPARAAQLAETAHINDDGYDWDRFELNQVVVFEAEIEEVLP